MSQPSATPPQSTQRRGLTPDEARTFSRFSPTNAAIVTAAIEARHCACEPYRDVFTFGRWLAQGRRVKRGEHALAKIPVIVPPERSEHEPDDAAEQPRSAPAKLLRTSALFCRCQTRDARHTATVGNDLDRARPGKDGSLAVRTRIRATFTMVVTARAISIFSPPAVGEPSVTASARANRPTSTAARPRDSPCFVAASSTSRTIFCRRPPRIFPASNHASAQLPSQRTGTLSAQVPSRSPSS